VGLEEGAQAAGELPQAPRELELGLLEGEVVAGEGLSDVQALEAGELPKDRLDVAEQAVRRIIPAGRGLRELPQSIQCGVGDQDGFFLELNPCSLTLATDIPHEPVT